MLAIVCFLLLHRRKRKQPPYHATEFPRTLTPPHDSKTTPVAHGELPIESLDGLQPHEQATRQTQHRANLSEHQGLLPQYNQTMQEVAQLRAQVQRLREDFGTMDTPPEYTPRVDTDTT